MLLYFRSLFCEIDWKKIISNLSLVFVALCFLGSAASTIYLLFNPHLFEKLWIVMKNNMNFWFIMFVGFGYGLWRKYSNPEEFSWKELPIQLAVGIIVTVGCFGTFLFWSSGLRDQEIWNGRVSIAEYYEAWTEEVTYTEEVCSGSGKDRTCRSVSKTRNDYHSPSWQIISSNDEKITISKENYRQFVSSFGNEKKVVLNRSNQVSSGDGDKYITNWSGGSDTIVSTAVFHEYVNYLKASKSIHKRSGTSNEYIQLLKPYPTIAGGKFGSIEFNRVINSGLNIPQKWQQEVDIAIDKALTTLGSQKQVNLIVYAVKSSNRNFMPALEEYWCYGKKNDVVLILGMDEFPNVKWAGVMIFHGNQDLRVKLRDAVEIKADVSDPKEFVEILVNNVQKHFKRVPMAELEHLLYDIEIPWWIIIIVWTLVGVVVCITSQYFENNGSF